MAVITLDKIIFRNNDSYLKMYKGSELIAEVESTPALDYLTFTAKAPSTIKFSRTNYSPSYSRDNGQTWTTIGSSTVSLSTGQSVKFKNVIGSTSSVSTNSFTLTGNLKLSGSIKSMLVGDNFASTTTIAKNYAFSFFFYNQTALTEIDGDIFAGITDITGTSAFDSMFYGTSITKPAPRLSASLRAGSICKSMYRNCTSLTETMDMSGSTIPLYSAINTYMCGYMYQGCTSLTTLVGKLPPIEHTTHPYKFISMFQGCTGLTTIPANYFNNITSLGAYDCQNMFYGCAGLTSIPTNLFSTINYVGASGFYAMFRGCTGLTNIPNFNEDLVLGGSSSMTQMFYGCTSLTSVSLPRMNHTSSSSSFGNMFGGCTNLSQVTNMDDFYTNKYSSWLNGVAASGVLYVKNDSKWSTGVIPSGWNVVEVYENSEFYIVPSTYNTTITLNLSDYVAGMPYISSHYNNYYYKNGYYGTWIQFPEAASSSVTLSSWMANHPTCLVGLVPSTSTTSINFFSWNDSTSRYNSRPGVGATLLGISGNYKVYYRDLGIPVDGNMIICNSGGTSQTSNINNIATIYSGGNVPYWSESGNTVTNVAISSITIVDEPSISIKGKLYIKGDIDDTAPSVNFAFDLGNNVDFAVGGDVRSIIVADDYGTDATRPTGLSTANEVDCIVEDRNISSTYIRDYYDDQYFKVYVYPPLQPLTFTALQSNSTVKFNRSGVTSEYSTDNGNTWTNGDNVTVTLSNNGDKVMYRGVTGTISTDPNDTAFTLGGRLKVSGSVMSMINKNPDDVSLSGKNYAFARYFDYQSSLKDISELKLSATTLSDYCYFNMFYSCTGLTTVPENLLPAKTLDNSCYRFMFKDCSGITTISANFLPATTLDGYCYSGMFQNCTSLTSTPNLPATTLADFCYSNMFQNCTSLTSTPNLPATTLSQYCYYGMFSYCTGLTTIPANFLPATTLNNQCYSNMFQGCTNLTTAPNLPATTLSQYCYSNMFQGCTSLTSTPNLPATTLVKYCYQYMFQNCTSLNRVVTYAQSISASYCLRSWLSGVSATGDFYNLGGAAYSSGVGGIPSGWTEHRSL